MESLLIIYKHSGETPLEAIGRYRRENPQHAAEKLGYAGRLDPMAEGLLLILVGEENKKRKEYEKLTKKYRFSFIPGITTDSYDMMGLIRAYNKPPATDLILKKLEKITPDFTGKFDQSYPPYSSAVADGKPLYYWARRGLLGSVTIPQKQVEIYELSYLSYKPFSVNEIISDAIGRIEKVKGDFRQKEIIAGWEEFGRSHKNENFTVFYMEATVSSGTYIRALVEEIGKKMEIGAVTFTIERTMVGDFEL